MSSGLTTRSSGPAPLTWSTNRADSRGPLPAVGLYHFDTSRVLIPTVTFVPALVPLMVVAPKENAGLPVETATGLLPGGGVVELLDGPLLQPAITMVAAMTPAITAVFIKRNAAQRQNERWAPAAVDIQFVSEPDGCLPFVPPCGFGDCCS